MSKVNPLNTELEEDFIDYLASIDRSKETIRQYRSILHIFWCWNLEYNDNKFYVDLKKREYARFQNHALNEWGWSPRRMRTVKAALSSLGNYIENILDDDFKHYKSIVNKIQSPADSAVREKTIFTEGELDGLLKHLVEEKQYMQACALSLCINSGSRKSELVQFKAGFFRPEFTICNGALYKTPEKMRTKGPGANGKQLERYVLAVPFNPYLHLWLKERERLGILSQWLLPKFRFEKWCDEPMTVYMLDMWAKEFTEYLGKPFYWHSIRHFYTTKLLSYGIPTSVVQDIVGWESADMVSLYDDTDKEEKFTKYFDEFGIRRIEPTMLTEI